MPKSIDDYENALLGRNIPILPLDNKWHRLMVGLEKTKEMKKDEEEIKELLKTQGRLNTEIKRAKALKKKLMDEIVGGMDDDDGGDKSEQNKNQIEECNDLIEAKTEELHELPNQIGEINYRLMLATMEQCYDIIQENTGGIEEISDWIANIRVELKKNVVRKQEMELKNQEIYSYMHDIFGASVIDLFDMKYNPGENMLHKKEEKKPAKEPEFKQEDVIQ